MSKIEGIEKIISWWPLFVTFPKWLQSAIFIWIIFTLTLASIVGYFALQEHRKILRISPNPAHTIIPKLNGDNNNIISVGLTVWAKKETVDIIIVNLEMLDEGTKKNSLYSPDITDFISQKLTLPLTLTSDDKKNIILHFPLSKKDAEFIKAKIHFIPYNIGDKQTLNLTIKRMPEGYQACIFYGRLHFEFGSFPGGGDKKEVKYLEEFRKKPEISIESQRR